MSDPLRTCPVRTLPISRGRKRQEPHQAEGVEPHVAEVFQPLGALVNARHRLDLVADLLVARQIAGAVAILDPELLGGLALGGEIFGLGPQVHHLGGQKSELAPDAFVGHDREVRRFSAHQCGAGQGTQAGEGTDPSCLRRVKTFDSYL